jgi:hypothetical protein
MKTNTNIDDLKLKVTWEAKRLYTYMQSATRGAGVQHGSHLNSSLQFFSQTNHARKSLREMLCRDRDLHAINVEKRQFRDRWMRK